MPTAPRSGEARITDCQSEFPACPRPRGQAKHGSPTASPSFLHAHGPEVRRSTDHRLPVRVSCMPTAPRSGEARITDCQSGFPACPRPRGQAKHESPTASPDFLHAHGPEVRRSTDHRLPVRISCMPTAPRSGEARIADSQSGVIAAAPWQRGLGLGQARIADRQSAIADLKAAAADRRPRRPPALLLPTRWNPRPPTLRLPTGWNLRPPALRLPPGWNRRPPDSARRSAGPARTSAL